MKIYSDKTYKKIQELKIKASESKIRIATLKVMVGEQGTKELHDELAREKKFYGNCIDQLTAIKAKSKHSREHNKNKNDAIGKEILKIVKSKLPKEVFESIRSQAIDNLKLYHGVDYSEIEGVA